MAAALVAVGLATATPGGPGASTMLGTARTTHGGLGTRPLAQVSLDGRAREAEAAHKVKAAHRTRVATTKHTGPCATSTLHWWICAAEHTLEQHGVARGRLSTNAAYIVVEHESGANPRAYNGWDSNAAAGPPSEGIAQVIGPTFRAYGLPGHHRIWNPLDNMIAAFRYAISRYGSMNNIPGVVNVRHGESYVGY